jgi:hypothetical protein
METLVTARRMAADERPLDTRGLLVGAGVVVGAAVLAAVLPGNAAARWLLAGVIALVLSYICLRSTSQGVLVTFAWLLALGFTRRTVSEFLADPGRDPLILVGVAAIVVLVVRSLLAGALTRLTLLAYALLAFSALTILELANPRQGGGLSRFAGLLVWLVPTLWFWVGRKLVDDRLAFRLLMLVGGATLAVSAYGIAQSVIGFPPWDQRWINVRGYASLYIGPDTVRPFGTFASASEFALACAVGAVVAATVFYRPRFLTPPARSPRADLRMSRRALAIRVLSLAAFGVASIALVLSAVRTTLVLLVIALPIVYLVLRGRRAFVLLVPAFALVALAVLALGQVNANDLSTNGPMAAVRRIVIVVQDPLSGYSPSAVNTNYANTLTLHYDNFKRGLDEGVHHPFGRGTGSTGVVGAQFGGKVDSTDTDISDAGIAFGVLGLLLTFGIVVLGFVTGVQAALRRRTFERVVLVGILIVTLGAWFQGAQYAMAPLLWLLLGRADAAASRDAQGVDETAVVSG